MIPFISTIFGFFKGSKIAQYIALITLVAGILGGSVKFIYQAGYDSAVAQQQEKAIEIQNAHMQALKEAKEKAATQAREETERRLASLAARHEINTNMREITHEIVNMDTGESDSCGLEFFRVFNNTICASGSGGNECNNRE